MALENQTLSINLAVHAADDITDLKQIKWGMTESKGDTSEEKNTRRVRVKEGKVMSMASLQLQQPFGQDSVISFSEMELVSVRKGLLCYFFPPSLFLKKTSLKVRLKSKQTVSRMKELSIGLNVGL